MLLRSLKWLVPPQDTAHPDGSGRVVKKTRPKSKAEAAQRGLRQRILETDDLLLAHLESLPARTQELESNPFPLSQLYAGARATDAALASPGTLLRGSELVPPSEAKRGAQRREKGVTVYLGSC